MSASATARTSQELQYRYDSIWNSAIRLIRVEMRLPVADKDVETGFILFDYQDHGKSYPGSLELVRGKGADGRDVVSAVVHVGGMPRYVERMIVDKLRKKLKLEYGEPAPRPAKPAPPKAEEPPADSPDAPNGPGGPGAAEQPSGQG
jgi:hypothetical protein